MHSAGSAYTISESSTALEGGFSASDSGLGLVCMVQGLGSSAITITIKMGQVQRSALPQKGSILFWNHHHFLEEPRQQPLTINISRLKARTAVLRRNDWTSTGITRADAKSLQARGSSHPIQMIISRHLASLSILLGTQRNHPEASNNSGSHQFWKPSWTRRSSTSNKNLGLFQLTRQRDLLCLESPRSFVRTSECFEQVLKGPSLKHSPAHHKAAILLWLRAGDEHSGFVAGNQTSAKHWALSGSFQPVRRLRSQVKPSETHTHTHTYRSVYIRTTKPSGTQISRVLPCKLVRAYL